MAHRIESELNEQPTEERERQPAQRSPLRVVSASRSRTPRVPVLIQMQLHVS